MQLLKFKTSIIWVFNHLTNYYFLVNNTHCHTEYTQPFNEIQDHPLLPISKYMMLIIHHQMDDSNCFLLVQQKL